MIGLPFIVQHIQTAGGYTFCMIISFLIGVFNTLAQSSSVAFSSIFYIDNYVELFFTGTGFSGFIICLTKSGLIEAYKDHPQKDFLIAETNMIIAATLTLSLFIFY